jgi:diguanylate cyclase (GGDEF)-like protein/PAS domain S-box-containing protein
MTVVREAGSIVRWDLRAGQRIEHHRDRLLRQAVDAVIAESSVADVTGLPADAEPRLVQNADGILTDAGNVATRPMSAPKPKRLLLVVEDNPGDARLIREMLAEQVTFQTELTHVTSMARAEDHLVHHPVDIVLLDLGLPDAEGIGAVERVQSVAPRVPVVVLTGLDDETVAGRALQLGAQDFLVKGEIDTRRLVRALRYALERAAMDDALFAVKERALVTLNSISDGVISTDVDGRVLFLNAAAERLTGWTGSDAAGRPMPEVFRILDFATRLPVSSAPVPASAPDQTVYLPPNALLVRRDGTEFSIDDAVSPIHDRDGRTIGTVIVFRDDSAARANARQMAHSAQHDYLTGLPNRMLVNDRIERAIAAAPRLHSQVAVLFLDLDGFKHINDSLGHSIGDKLLQSVAQRLVGCVRTSDTVSRPGGDEFVVLISPAEQWDAAIVARRMLAAVAEVHRIDQHELHVTASIGVSVYPADGGDAETLIKNADTAMYQAKANGRQRFQFFEPSMNVRAVERQSIEEGLRTAIVRNEFTLHYQPKVDLRTGLITGAEALLRWTHPTRGNVPPLQFIPIAEDSGLIVPIGHWVLRSACEQASAWVAAGLPIGTMAVNVSTRELQDDGFFAGLLRVLAETGLDPRILELELTESVLMKQPEAVASILQAVRDLGVRVSLDDFGTGYSSLSYLHAFPIDALKVDQSFIAQIASVADDTSLVTAVIGIARSLKLRVIAEGVETLGQLAFLQAHDCDEAQGYYFSRPVPSLQFAALMRESGALSSPEATAVPV